MLTSSKIIRVSQRKRKRYNQQRDAESKNTCYPKAKTKDNIPNQHHSKLYIDLTDDITTPSVPSPSNNTHPIVYTLDNLLFCPPNTYLGSSKMDAAITQLRSSCTYNTFIANADTATYLHAFNHTWNRISTEFGPSNVRNKPSGIYLLPFFCGHHMSGHWLLVVLHHHHSTWTGWIINSLPTSPTLATHIKYTFETTLNVTITWHQPICTLQEEVECGPRTIMNIAIIILTLKANRPLQDSLDVIANSSLLSDTHPLPLLSRRFCSQLIIPPHHFEHLLHHYYQHSRTPLSPITPSHTIIARPFTPIPPSTTTTHQHSQEQSIYNTSPSLSIQYPTSLLSFTTIFTHIISNNRVSHLVVKHNTALFKININHISLLNNNSQSLLARYLKFCPTTIDTTKLKILDHNTFTIVSTTTKYHFS